MDYSKDERVVMTLDAGGTNFVFSALQGNREIISPVRLPSEQRDLDKCLNTLCEGFTLVKERLGDVPMAISFAFPGPADYENGVIGDLPNLPAFRGGVPLKDFLQSKFRIPVFINNDGNLFAYGEALAGSLPELNRQLQAKGNPLRYRNLIGITLGTGFGAGVVIGGELLTGDNGCGGDVWVFRNKNYADMIAEESVSIRAVKRVYAELSGEKNPNLTPKDLFDIAEGRREGNRQAALGSFAALGEQLGDSLSFVLTLIDGVVVIGGGLSGASRFIFPAMLKEMNRKFARFDDSSVPRLQMDVYDLTDTAQREILLRQETTEIPVPGTDLKSIYRLHKKTGVMVSTLDTSFAINLGAYNFALNEIDKRQA